MNKNTPIWGKIALIAVILFSAMGSANATEPNVTIEISGTAVVDEITTNIIKVNFTDFATPASYFINVIKDNNSNGVWDSDDQYVYSKSGSLNGLAAEIISVDWIPEATGLHWVDALGAFRSTRVGVFVSDTKEVSPVPELTTVVLISTGIMGLIWTRWRSK